LSFVLGGTVLAATPAAAAAHTSTTASAAAFTYDAPAISHDVQRDVAGRVVRRQTTSSSRVPPLANRWLEGGSLLGGGNQVYIPTVDPAWLVAP
jgi:hypothetical protein